MDFDVTFDDRAVQRGLNRLLRAGRDLSPATRDIADTLAVEADTAFERQADPTTGQPWAPLAPATLRDRELRGRSASNILVDSGQLVASINAQSGPDFAAAVTNKVYGPIHQFGGEAGRKSARVEIPARPFFGLSAEGQDEITSILQDHLTAAFDG